MKEELSKYDLSSVTKIYSSPEKKTMMIAEYISREYDIPMVIEQKVAEVDRSKVGYIEGDYAKIVGKYLSQNEFPYAWESFDSVEKRGRDFIASLDSNDCVIISHGMFLSILLHKYYRKDIIEFWKNLKFGEIMNVELDTLKKIFIQ
jgi:broad specificity phosphatase PhoE